MLLVRQIRAGDIAQIAGIINEAGLSIYDITRLFWCIPLKCAQGAS